MTAYAFVLIAVILQGIYLSVKGIAVSSINCGDICSAVSGSPYTLTCTWSGSLTTGIMWQRDGVILMVCNVTGVCIPATSGYATGTYPNTTSATLTITSFDSTRDSGLWECRDGAYRTVSCTLPSVATGSLQGQCTVNGNSHDISCSGITSHGTPAVPLELKEGSTVLASTTSGDSVSTTQTDAAGKTYTCEVTGTAATCLSPSSVDITCPAPAPGR